MLTWIASRTAAVRSPISPSPRSRRPTPATGSRPTAGAASRFLRSAHGAGLPVHVWTVNDPATMHELLDLGVDGIMTDRLRLLRDVFASRGITLNGGAAPTAPERDTRAHC